MNGVNLLFTNWFPDEPNNAGNEDCVEFELNPATGTFGWNDLSCSRTMVGDPMRPMRFYIGALNGLIMISFCQEMVFWQFSSKAAVERLNAPQQVYVSAELTAVF